MVSEHYYETGRLSGQERRTAAGTRGRSERSGREEGNAALDRSRGSGAPNQPDSPRLLLTVEMCGSVPEYSGAGT